MPDQPAADLTLLRMICDLERLRNEAATADLPVLAYLIDMALIEAREQAGKGGPPNRETP